MSIVEVLLAASIGLVLGFLGSGGSILMVPALVYLVHVPPRQAVVMSLPIVGLAALIGAVSHARSGRLRLRTAMPFAAAAVAGAFAGARISGVLGPAIQLALLGIVMLAAAVFMLRGAAAERAGPPVGKPRWLIVVVGSAVGLLTGLLGIGGGFLIVPSLVVLVGLPMMEAVSTSLLVITVTAAAGLSGYLGTADIPWVTVAGFAAITMAGSVTGTRLAGRVPAALLRRAFGVFLLVLGTFIVYLNRHALV